MPATNTASQLTDPIQRKIYCSKCYSIESNVDFYSIKANPDEIGKEADQYQRFTDKANPSSVKDQ
jgi:hypothetical protein